jgi:cob(I)alamin adenosyltransferase
VKIYTKTGDSGTTGLLGGARVAKDDPRVAAYGDVDEANAVIGSAIALATGPLATLLSGIQKDLFAIGARLADPTHAVAARRAKAAVTNAQVRKLEKQIDARERELPPLRAFVLPGGSPLGATLHHARTVVRRAERSVVALAHQADVEPGVVVYLNRLSDLLFVLARHANHRAGKREERW